MQIDGPERSNAMATTRTAQAACGSLAVNQRDPADHAARAIHWPEGKVLMPRKALLAGLLDQQQVLKERRLDAQQGASDGARSSEEIARPEPVGVTMWIEPLVQQSIEVRRTCRDPAVDVQHLSAARMLRCKQFLDPVAEYLDLLPGQHTRDLAETITVEL